jgi:hypothetical protein
MYYNTTGIKEEHSNKTKKGMLEKGMTSEEISKRTKEGMKAPEIREKCKFWKGKIKINNGFKMIGIEPYLYDFYYSQGWELGLLIKNQKET